MSSTDLSGLKRCPCCRGKREVMGAGMMFHECKNCLGVGYVETGNYEEQDQFKDTENSATEAALDQSASDSRKTKRKYVRKAAMGVSDQNLQE